MPGISNPANQSPRLTAQINMVSDPAPGVPLLSPSGSIVQAYYGQVGGKLYWSEDQAGQETYAAVRPNVINPPGTAAAQCLVLGGVFQYVKLASSVLAANAVVGRLVAWDLSVSADQYQVYDPLTTDNNGNPLLAGVLLNPTAAQTTNSQGLAIPGNFCWMQIAGRCVLQLSTQTLATTKSNFLVWSRSSTAGDLMSVQYMASTATFSNVLAGTPPNDTATSFSDFVGVVESGNAAAPALPTTAGAYVIANVPVGRFAWRQ